MMDDFFASACLTAIGVCILVIFCGIVVSMGRLAVDVFSGGHGEEAAPLPREPTPEAQIVQRVLTAADILQDNPHVSILLRLLGTGCTLEQALAAYCEPVATLDTAIQAIGTSVMTLPPDHGKGTLFFKVCSACDSVVGGYVLKSENTQRPPATPTPCPRCGMQEWFLERQDLYRRRKARQ